MDSGHTGEGGWDWSQETPENSARHWLTALGLTISFGDGACPVMSVTGVYGAIGTCRDSRQHLKGRLALNLELNGLFIESLPSYSSQCNRFRVTQALFTHFLMTSVWKPEGEGTNSFWLLLLIGQHRSWQTCPESCLRSSSTSSQMYFVPKRSMKAFSFLISRASCYNTKKLPPNTNSITTVFGSLLKTGLGNVLKWF